MAQLRAFYSKMAPLSLIRGPCVSNFFPPPPVLFCYSVAAGQEKRISPVKVAESRRVAEAFGERVAVDLQLCYLMNKWREKRYEY